VATLLRELADRIDRAEVSAQQAELAELRQADEDELEGQVFRLLLALEEAGLLGPEHYAERLADASLAAEPANLPCTDDLDQSYDDALDRYRQRQEQARQAELARHELPAALDPLALALEASRAARAAGRVH
jgi:hypothetical protein